MGTEDFNALDLFLGRWRSRIVRQSVDPGDRVLDFGCGHQGLFLCSLKDVIRTGVGLDKDAEPGQRAPNVEIQRFHFKDRLEFPDQHFDKITILAVLEHIPLDMVTPLLAEFHRILKKDGSVLITTPTPASKPLLEFLAFKLKIISAAEIADHKHYYSRADMNAVAAKHGFECSTYRTFQFGLNSFSVFSKSPGPARA